MVIPTFFIIFVHMLTFKVQVEYRIGDTVYNKTDTSQERYIITNYVCNDRQVVYEVSKNGELSYFQGFELTPDEDKLYKIEKL